MNVYDFSIIFVFLDERVPEDFIQWSGCQVRTISLAYSRITFADIAAKLKVDSSEDAEHIVAKVGLITGL